MIEALLQETTNQIDLAYIWNTIIDITQNYFWSFFLWGAAGLLGLYLAYTDLTNARENPLVRFVFSFLIAGLLIGTFIIYPDIGVRLFTNPIDGLIYIAWAFLFGGILFGIFIFFVAGWGLGILFNPRR